MKTFAKAIVVGCGVVALGALVWLWSTRWSAPAMFGPMSSAARSTPQGLASSEVGSQRVEAAAGTASSVSLKSGLVALPADQRVPRNAEELAQLVAWMRSLGRDELLRLSNAEFGFRQSELVEILRGLSGDWVVEALGGMAVAESDPLVKAVLVEGLAGGFSWERVEDSRLLPVLDALMSQMSLASEDPFHVAGNLPNTAFMTCAKNGADYVQLVAPHLAASDNGQLLIKGYLFMGMQSVEGGELIVQQMLLSHTDPDGRLGALEGLRSLAIGGRIPSAQLTTLGLSALDVETDPRNRLLVYEMMISAGGEDGLSAVERIVREGDTEAITQSAEALALKMDAQRALTLFHDVLARQELDGDAKQALFNAMGLVDGEEGADFLLAIAKDARRDDSERLAGLRALVNRPLDDRLTAELQGVFDTADDPALRTEALRMMVGGSGEDTALDLREIGAVDSDAAVRAEAVQLAAMQPSADTREWLEERLHQDASLDVKAAALGALVYQAHYTGDGEAVLGYLAQARKFTDDEGAQQMIAEGERMVRDFDPRRLELELAEEARAWSTIAKYTSGPAARGFERQARQMEKLVSSLRLAASPSTH